jgi:hypothetical protein
MSEWLARSAVAVGLISTPAFADEVKIDDLIVAKTIPAARRSRNHLLDQVESFRVGDRDSDREDDLLDTFCYGIAVALGNSEGF